MSTSQLKTIARWKSTSENGQAPAPGFYVSNNGPTAELAMLVGALLKANGAPVKLFPAGEARLERLTDTTVEDHGQKMHVTDFAVTGLSFEPQTVWLDDDQHFFGFPSKWFATLREGWESANDQLYALDRSAEDARNARLARELAQHLAFSTYDHDLVFSNYGLLGIESPSTAWAWTCISKRPGSNVRRTCSTASG